MPAIFIQIHPTHPEPRKIAQVLEILKAGGVIIYPTDTVYGMGCDIHQSKAVERIAQIKGIRPEKNNFAFICNDFSHIADYAKVSNAAFKLLKKSLPGAFTFILNATGLVPKLLHSKKKTVGIRIPDHAIPRTIVAQLGNPILTTSIKSADDFFEYPTDPEEIFHAFQHKVDAIIDGGIGGLLPSTIIDATDDDFSVIRQGLGELQ